MYQTSDNYKSKILNVKPLKKVYIDGNEVNPKHILDCKLSKPLFSNDEFTLGTVTSQGVELLLYKEAVPETINKIYIESGIIGEAVPIGYFNVDDIARVDDYTVKLKLLDDMVKFESNYDGSTLNYPCTLKRLLQDICSKMGVELRFYFFFEYG